jgi:hypothetical protein
MKKLTLFGLIFILSCQKEIPFEVFLPSDFVSDRGTCMRNGELWEASASCLFEPSDSTKISFLLGTVDFEGTLRESFAISFVPPKVGKYGIDNDGEFGQVPYGSFWVGYDDETDAFWNNTVTNDNYIEITSIDSVDNSIKANFHLKLKKDRGENYPKYVTFSEGHIETKLPN